MQTMMAVEGIQGTVAELLDRLSPGDEVILTKDRMPVAKLMIEPQSLSPGTKTSRPGPGLCKGIITYMAPDFDAPLEDMKEYME